MTGVRHMYLTPISLYTTLKRFRKPKGLGGMYNMNLFTKK